MSSNHPSDTLTISVGRAGSRNSNPDWSRSPIRLSREPGMRSVSFPEFKQQTTDFPGFLQ
jgi:hypothetical protein